MKLLLGVFGYCKVGCDDADDVPYGQTSPEKNHSTEAIQDIPSQALLSSPTAGE